MGGCQSTPAGDGQAISTNSSNNTSRGAAPASKYVEGTGQGQSQVDRQSKLDEGNDTYITALPGNPSAASSRGTPAPAATADPASKGAAASPSNGAGAASSLAGVSTQNFSHVTDDIGGVADDEGGGGSAADEDDDYFTENSSDDGSYNTENSSDEDGSYHTDNSSDGEGSGKDEDEDEGPINETPLQQVKRGGGTPDAAAATPTFQLASVDAGGAAWKRGTKSFRVRMTNSRPLTPAVLKILLTSEKAGIDTEYDNIPLNNEKFDNLPRFTEAKNRYFNILPNAHSRIVLDQINDDETSSYVNGNWMPGYEAEKAYIACQGPLPDTIHDFWRMVWENSCATIVMNTGLVEGPTETVKCERYWPASPDDEPMLIGEGAHEFKIISVQEARPKPQFVQTLLEVHFKGETRQITHLWWRDWPDKGVPKTANGIGHYIDAARASREEHGGPVVIHCSAGVGRTGCFLGIDYCMKQFDAMKTIDILGCVCKLRQSRGLTVQTASQYRFIHMVMDRYMNGVLYEDMAEPEKKARRKSSRSALTTPSTSATSPDAKQASAASSPASTEASPPAADAASDASLPTGGGGSVPPPTSKLSTKRRSSSRRLSSTDEGALPRSTSESMFDVDGTIIVTAKLTPSGALVAKPKRKSKRRGRKPMRAKNQSVQAIGPRPSWPPAAPEGGLAQTIAE